MPAFDSIAASYDQDFTQSLTGILQRNVVREYLDHSLPSEKSLNILELGCGTGEDAIYLARKGHRVRAIDVSEKMIAVASAKAKREKLAGEVRFEVMDMRQLEVRDNSSPYDLVFSNFGALNCLDPNEMKILFHALNNLLSDQGRIIAVIMPSFCLWESAYFMLKGKRKLVFRRMKKEGIVAELNGEGIRTYYSSPRKIRAAAKGFFHATRSRPVGFFLPPSYLDPFFSRKRGWLNLLEKMEGWVSNISTLSGASDHYIIELKRKK